METNVDLQVRRSRLSRRLLGQYLFTLLAFAAGFAVLFFLGFLVSATVYWHSDSPLYRLLMLLWDSMLLWIPALLLAGWGGITYHFIKKPLGYLDELVQAAQQLSHPQETPLVLSGELAEISTELNAVREQALRDARAAHAAEQRKNDLIVYLAHDLKTPLTSVIGYLTLLRDEPQISDELRAKYTDVALRKAERLEDLLNEFFEITRFNLSQLRLECEPINLTRMLEQTTFEFTPVLADKDLHWDTQLAPDVTLWGDPDKLARVFDNLLRNAVAYSARGTAVRVQLACTAHEATVTVENHGKTIPPEKLSRIFEQFFRLDSSRASDTGGAGLGLAIAKEIVELHGGSITPASAQETVVFTVTLPLERRD